MKRVIAISLFLAFSIAGLTAQKYFTRSGNITFFSDAPLENIEAVNQNATAVMDTETGRLEFAVLIKAFQFEKAKMQEDFNKNYLESSEYPKANFKGEVSNWGEVDLEPADTAQVSVKGDLTIHGVTHTIKATGELTKTNGEIKARSEFMVTVADYDIEVPSVVRQKIAEEVEVTVEVSLEPMEEQN